MIFSIIYNPIATGFKQSVLDHLVFKFIEKGWSLNKVCRSEYAGHVPELIRELDPVSDYIITLGGDGTVSEAFHAFKDIEQHCHYAHISVGTTNDMACNFNLFRKDPIKSIDKLAEKAVDCETDCILCNGEPISYVSAFGYVAPVPYLTSGDLKKKLGHGAYVVSALPIMMKKPEKVSLDFTANGQTKHIRTTLALITNSKGMGGITLYPTVDRNDGKFEVIFLNNLAADVIPPLFGHYLTDTINLADCIKLGDVFSTDCLDITFTGELPRHQVDNDGEKSQFVLDSTHKTLHYELGKKIKIFMPQE